MPTHDFTLVSMEVDISITLPTPGRTTQLLEGVSQGHSGVGYRALCHRLLGCGLRRGQRLFAASHLVTICEVIYSSIVREGEILYCEGSTVLGGKYCQGSTVL